MDRKVRILVVEDEFIIAHDLQTTLQGMGYDVPKVLASAGQIIDVVKEVQPDLVLMDINLEGDIDGIEAAGLIKSKFTIPILYLTSYTDEKTVNRAKVTEPHGYIIKPFHQRELRTTIEMAMYKAEMDRRLKENQQWLTTILNGMGDAVVSMDRSGMVNFLNPLAEILSGWANSEAKGKSIDEVIWLGKEKSNERVKAPFLEVVQSGRLIRLGNLVLTSKNGQVIYVDENWNPIRDQNGEVIGVVLILRNIAEQKEAEAKHRDLEAQILHMQKLESLGVLAGGIAHDFNNLLCIILGNTSLALSGQANPSLIKEKIKQIEITALRASDLVKQILSYSGKTPSVMEITDLIQVIAEMGALLETSISKKVNVVYNHTNALPPLMADTSQLRQVIMNLMINASEAIGEKIGTIRVSTGVVDVDHELLARAWMGHDLKPGKFIFLEVKDSGCGMDEATRSKIFDPFFTTKFTGRGLGLAVVIGIVRAHGGAIFVESAVGEGTTFRLLLSIGVLKKVNPPLLDPDLHSKRNLKKGGMILVVDDEGNILTVVREILENEGFEVITASSGAEGVEVLKQRAPDIVAVLLDYTMPDMDGGQAMVEMRKLRADLPIVLASGYQEDEITSRILSKKVPYFIKKPFLPTDLLRKMYEAMDSGEAKPPTVVN